MTEVERMTAYERLPPTSDGESGHLLYKKISISFVKNLEKN